MSRLSTKQRRSGRRRRDRHAFYRLWDRMLSAQRNREIPLGAEVLLSGRRFLGWRAEGGDGAWTEVPALAPEGGR